MRIVCSCQANELAEKKRIKEQAQALKKEEKKKKGKTTGDVELGGKALEEVEDDDLKNIDKDALIKAKKAQEEKLKRDAEERMNLAVQKLDHLANILKSELYRDCTESRQLGGTDVLIISVFLSWQERARRENERDLLDKRYEEQKEQDMERWKVESKQFMENHAKKHAEDVEAKKRMKRMYNSQKYARYV